MRKAPSAEGQAMRLVYKSAIRSAGARRTPLHMRHPAAKGDKGGEGMLEITVFFPGEFSRRFTVPHILCRSSCYCEKFCCNTVDKVDVAAHFADW
jgi:hypothetical protein